MTEHPTLSLSPATRAYTTLLAVQRIASESWDSATDALNAMEEIRVLVETEISKRCDVCGEPFVENPAWEPGKPLMRFIHGFEYAYATMDDDHEPQPPEDGGE